MEVRRNIQSIRRRIREAAMRAGRCPEEIKLVAVTKRVPIELVREAVEKGVADLAESRVQEAMEKIAAIDRTDIHWHFIGNLQTNKVKQVIPSFDIVHSLDRWRLAEALEERGKELGQQVPVLIEVNISGEKSKHGLTPLELGDFLVDLRRLPHLSPHGLMTMAPFTPVVEETRPVFRELKRLFVQITKEMKPGENWRHLSMGMSNDFEVAVEEGATLVRIGSAIFAAETDA